MAQQWPGAGEIDILEGVHNNQHDQVTWHTAPGCNLTDAAPAPFSGTAISTNCYANEVGGCGIVDWSRASYGPLFNALGGGVYAMRWDASAIDVWFFYRAAVPSDITLGAPDPTPDNWGTPSASLSNVGCDLDKYFVDHAIVFDITGACVHCLVDKTHSSCSMRGLVRGLRASMYLACANPRPGQARRTSRTGAPAAVQTASWILPTSTCVSARI